jgi:hypothetical protein
VTGERGHTSASENAFALSAPPTITKQPEAASGCQGGTVALVVEASGVGLKYQWRLNGAPINGATAPTYTIASLSATTAGKYDVVITGACNPSATSKPITVAVAPSTAITTQPSNVTVEAGKPFSLVVAATGDSLTYQWSLNGTDIPAPAGTNATYTVVTAKSLDAGSYACRVRGVCGEVSSATAVVDVTPSTGVDENEPYGFRLIGPQPATDHVTVQIVPSSSPVTFVVTDLRGATHVTVTSGGSEGFVNIPLANVPSGTYLVRRTGIERGQFQHVIVVMH